MRALVIGASIVGADGGIGPSKPLLGLYILETSSLHSPGVQRLRSWKMSYPGSRGVISSPSSMVKKSSSVVLRGLVTSGVRGLVTSGTVNLNASGI